MRVVTITSTRANKDYREPDAQKWARPDLTERGAG
jgi:hypothetical protein